MIKWPEDIVNDIARRKSVLFLGSGISMNSTSPSGVRPKTWAAFLNSLLPQITPNKHIKDLIKENDFLTACEIIKRELGRANFTRAVEAEFLTPGYQPAEIHEVLFNLDSRIVATPNFDKIYETYANAQANGSIVVKQHNDNDVSSFVRSPGRLILKLHGTIDSPDNLIFTRAEYAEARTKYSAFYEILEALSITHTFIFMGCGINDPDIKLLLEDTLFKHNSSRGHLMLLPKEGVHKSVAKVVEDTMNLQVIRYSSANNHVELLDSLKQLQALVEQEREELGETQNW
ncbi:SIR2 family protein [Vibrio chagasii]|uniref:SIR2 family protein n=1 Tax=Vibrio chagasii TaxID=170679 RepID=UPI0022849FB5|nr:SIR2 family protein [Vibrio chagasii]MCY9828591.1 SIR2 family protein [Vibrio chagasii]